MEVSSTMNQTYINELKGRIGDVVTLKGWLYNSRSSGKLVFLQLRDGTGIVLRPFEVLTLRLTGDHT